MHAPYWNLLAGITVSASHLAVNSVAVSVSLDIYNILCIQKYGNLNFTAIAEDCKSYVLSALALSVVLDCDRYPQSNDPNVCINLASTSKSYFFLYLDRYILFTFNMVFFLLKSIAPEGECLPGEYRCNSDNTCIPERWVCDGRQDCSQGDDEFSCGQCTDTEFKCESENRCVPLRWRCDGSRDCGDGSDERECPSSQGILS